MRIQIETASKVQFEINQIRGLNFDVHNKTTDTRVNLTLGQLQELLKNMSITDEKSIREEAARQERLHHFYTSGL